LNKDGNNKEEEKDYENGMKEVIVGTDIDA
jgi:hypothetical protein